VDLTSGIFIVAAAGIFFKIRQQLAAALAGTFFFLLFLFLHLPRLLSHLHDPIQWTVASEVLALGSGAFVIAYFLSNGMYGRPQWIKVINTIGIISRYLFALSLIIFAIQHMMYETYIETLIPSWLPAAVSGIAFSITWSTWRGDAGRANSAGHGGIIQQSADPFI
jgi:hypothetical protein